VRRTSQISTQSRRKTLRLLALTVLLAFLIVSLLPEAFILAYAHHEHHHPGTFALSHDSSEHRHGDLSEGCTTCAQIQSAENFIRRWGGAVGSALFALVSFFIAVAALYAMPSFTGCRTPIQLKTRMNN